MSLTATDLYTNDVANDYLPDYIWRKWTHGTILFTLKIRCRRLKTELSDPGKRQAGGGDVTSSRAQISEGEIAFKSNDVSRKPVEFFLGLMERLSKC